MISKKFIVMEGKNLKIKNLNSRTIIEAGQSILYSKANLALFLWAVAMNTTVHVINKTGPTRQGDKRRYELWYGKRSGLENFRVFGTECFAHKAAKRRKFAQKARKGYLLDYLDERQGYRVYRVVVSCRDVIFKSELVSMKVVKIGLPKSILRIKESLSFYRKKE